MNPKEALDKILLKVYSSQEWYEKYGEPRFVEALSVLRALVEQLTVEEVRGEILRRLNNLPHTEPYDSAHILGSCLIDFIDSKKKRGNDQYRA